MIDMLHICCSISVIYQTCVETMCFLRNISCIGVICWNRILLACFILWNWGGGNCQTSLWKIIQDPAAHLRGKWWFSEDRGVYCELIVEGLERMESPLTDSVASFLITIGWFVNIVPLWFNLLCAVRRKQFPERAWRGLLIYLLCINSVLAGERTPTISSPK